MVDERIKKQFSKINILQLSLILFVYQSTQTLLDLNLAFNRISIRGIQDLASALENSTKKHGFHACFAADRHYSTQSLARLNLSGNNISDQGAEYLAQALEKNKVKQIFFTN